MINRCGCAVLWNGPPDLPLFTEADEAGPSRQKQQTYPPDKTRPHGAHRRARVA